MGCSSKPCGAYFFAFFENFFVPILTSGGLAAVSSSFFAALYSALKMIVLSEESTTEKLSHIKAIEKDSHLKTVLGKVNPKIESKSRNFIRMGLLKEQTLVCYAMLYLKYKL